MLIDRVKKQICRKIEDSKEELISIVQDLVRIPTENTPPVGSEKAAQEYVKGIFDSIRVENKFVNLDKVSGLPEHEAFYPGRNYKDRPNFVARYSGKGEGKSLLFSGHIDTMPIGDAPWEHNPFDGEIEGNRLYGRGSYDMKGGIGAMIMAVKSLASVGIELKGDLLFESVVDEEHAGCNGTLANRLIGHNADAAVLAEPSNLHIFTAHKGFRIVHLVVKGNPGMSFAGEKLENPVEHVGRLIECIKMFREKRRKDVNIPAIYKDAEDPVPVFMPKLQAGEFSYKVPMTIPNACKLEVYWQTMPGEKQEDIEQEFFAFLDSWCKTDEFFRRNPPGWEFSHRWMPGTQISKNHPIVRTVKEIAEEITNQAINIKGAPYPCDLFIFNLYGDMPGIVLGPRGRNAHGVDEFVYIEDIVNLAKIFACTALEWCGIK